MVIRLKSVIGSWTFKSLFLKIFYSMIVLLPVVAAGVSVGRFIGYFGVYFALVSFFSTINRRNQVLVPELSMLLFSLALLRFEQSSFAGLPVQVIISYWFVLSIFISRRPQLRRILTFNILIFATLFFLVEIFFRGFTNSQFSSDYQSIEIFRNPRTDGPGILPGPDPGRTSDGFRITTDQPKVFDSRILIFGGSTTFCAEVDDSATFPSQLQRLLNGGASRSRVENYGKSAATATDRVEILRKVKLNPADIVIFYIGVNEAGVGFTQRDVPVEIVQQIPQIGIALQKVSSYSRVADIVFRSLVFGGVSRTESSKAEALENFSSAMSSAEEITNEAGAKFIPVLQANLFTRNPSTPYDRELGSLYGSDLEPVVSEMYDQMLPIVKSYTFGADATDVMNNLSPSPYYDWHHVNAEGNSRIASFINDLISRN